MADAPASVKITGLKELSGAFRAVDKDIPKHIQREFKALADHVVGVAQQRMPFVTGEAAKSLKPRATGRGTASIAFNAGGPENRETKGAYYPWLDFGGGTPGARGVTSSSPITHTRSLTGTFRRAVVKGGRYLYPAIAESRSEIERRALDAMENAARENKFDVKGTL